MSIPFAVIVVIAALVLFYYFIIRPISAIGDIPVEIRRLRESIDNLTAEVRNQNKTNNNNSLNS